MGSGPGEFSYEALDASLASSTGKPYRRDTSIVYAGPGPSFAGVPITPYAPGGWRLFRVTVTDPGAWVFHCHITPHMAMGMRECLTGQCRCCDVKPIYFFLVSIETMFLNGAEHLPPLPPGYAKGYLTFGGGAFGNDTYDPGMPKYFNMMRKKEKLGVH
jgi:L-ascorbate oxidase